MQRSIVLIVAFSVAFAIFGSAWLLNTDYNIQDQRHFRIGLLHPNEVDTVTMEGLKAGLAELGYIEGENISYEYNGPAGHNETLKASAVDLIRRNVDAVFVSSTPAALAIKLATADNYIPVVFGPVNDPVGAGIVDTLRRPAGNITGVTLAPSGGRRMWWLSKIVPSAKRILVPYNPENRSSVATLIQAKKGAGELSLEVVTWVVRNDNDITALLIKLTREVDAIFLPRDALITARITDFSAAAIEKRISLSAPGVIQVKAGALFSYGFEHYSVGFQGARLVDKILKGLDPGLLPVESAESHLYINVRTAEAIGLKIPDHLLRQTARIIR